MPYYHLLVVDTQQALETAASDSDDALRIFGEKLGLRLTLIDQDIPASYMLDEWQESPHWVNPTIPVFEIPN